MTTLSAADARSRAAAEPGAAPVQGWRPFVLGAASGILMTVVAAALIPLGILTLFRARRVYSRIACWTSRAILGLYGVRLRVHQERPFPCTQVVYVSNHTSTLDLFILVALGLPNCRFFLSGFLRKIVPLGVISWMMGTFFTVPQDRPEERRRIFENAARTLRKTGESVYLSPEGGRITSGEVGHFNKGAFHLAISLAAPIVPLYFHVPKTTDPGLGYNPRPGVVDVYVLPAIDTSAWDVRDLIAHTQQVREVFVRVHEDKRCA